MKVSKEDEDDSKTKEEMKNESDQSDDNSDGDGNSGSFAAGEDAEVRDVIYQAGAACLVRQRVSW